VMDWWGVLGWSGGDGYSAGVEVERPCRDIPSNL
jgi:hypothetical protein